MAPPQYKAGGLHHLAADLLKGPGPQVGHIHNIRRLEQFGPQLLKAAEEHPGVLGDHGLVAVFSGEPPAPLHEAGEQVALAVRIVFLDKLVQGRVAVAHRHIGRVGHYHIVLPGQQPPEVPGVQLFLVVPAEQGQLLRRLRPGFQLIHRQQGSVFLAIGIAVRRIQVGPDAPGENAPVVLPCLHHHRKVGQLGGPVVDVQAIQVVLQDTLGGVPLAPSLALIDLHEDFKGVDQDVPAAHAGVDELDVLGLKFGIGGSQRPKGIIKGVIPIFRLLRFIQIVLPFALKGLDFRFMLIHGVGFTVIRMPHRLVAFQVVDPQPPQGVLHHVPHNPVRGEELGDSRNLLPGNLAVFGKGGVLRLGVIVLVQPADDLHLAALFDVEVVLVDVVDQMVHDAVLVHHGEVQKQLRVVAGLLEQGR